MARRSFNCYSLNGERQCPIAKRIPGSVKRASFFCLVGGGFLFLAGCSGGSSNSPTTPTPAPTSFRVSGDVTRVDAGLEGTFNTSQTMSALWVVDSLATDENPDTRIGVYSLSSFEISVDGFAPVVDGGNHIVRNNFNVDGLEVNITDPFGATIVAPTVVPGQTVVQIVLDFQDFISLLFSSDALTTDFTLTDFSSAVWSIRFGQFEGSTQIEFGRVSGGIRDLAVVTAGA